MLKYFFKSHCEFLGKIVLGGHILKCDQKRAIIEVKYPQICICDLSQLAVVGTETYLVSCRGI